MGERERGGVKVDKGKKKLAGSLFAVSGSLVIKPRVKEEHEDPGGFG